MVKIMRNSDKFLILNFVYIYIFCYLLLIYFIEPSPDRIKNICYNNTFTPTDFCLMIAEICYTVTKIYDYSLF